MATLSIDLPDLGVDGDVVVIITRTPLVGTGGAMFTGDYFADDYFPNDYFPNTDAPAPPAGYDPLRLYSHALMRRTRRYFESYTARG